MNETSSQSGGSPPPPWDGGAAGPPWQPGPPGASGSATAAAGLPGPLPFTELLDEAWRRCRRHLRTLYLPFALPMAVVTASIPALQAMLQNPAAPIPTDPLQMLSRTCTFPLLLAPVLLLLAVFYTAMVAAAVQTVTGAGVDVGRALRFAIRPRVLGTVVLAYIAVFASALCCIAPILFVAPLLGLVVPAMAVVGVTGIAALRRSADLTLYRPGGGARRLSELVPYALLKVLAIAAVQLALTYLLSLMVELPLQGGRWFAVIRQAASGEDVRTTLASMLWRDVPANFLSSLGATVIHLYASFALVLLYFDVRARREGEDLRQAVASMAVPDAGEPV